MNTFLNELTAAIQATVVKSLTEKISQFANAVSKASDGKLTPEQVMKVWNELYPEVKAVDATVATVATDQKKDTPSQRTKTDKSRKCQVIKQSGKNKGEICGKNCVLEKDTCTSHTPSGPKEPSKNKPSGSDDNATKKKPIHPSETTDQIDSDEDLKSMTVIKLKELLRAAKISFGSKDRKDVLISYLVKSRGKNNSSSMEDTKKKDERSPSTQVVKKQKEEAVEEEAVEEEAVEEEAVEEEAVEEEEVEEEEVEEEEVEEEEVEEETD
jgi:hypothetical protein